MPDATPGSDTYPASQATVNTACHQLFSSCHSAPCRHVAGAIPDDCRAPSTSSTEPLVWIVKPDCDDVRPIWPAPVNVTSLTCDAPTP